METDLSGAARPRSARATVRAAAVTRKFQPPAPVLWLACCPLPALFRSVAEIVRDSDAGDAGLSTRNIKQRLSSYIVFFFIRLVCIPVASRLYAWLARVCPDQGAVFTAFARPAKLAAAPEAARRHCWEPPSTQKTGNFSEKIWHPRNRTPERFMNIWNRNFCTNF